MDFHGIDLNLLVAFDALMSERNVTRAATQVGVSQPAMSAALSRLRLRFGDPLFLRSGEGLQPTLRAIDLGEPISQALRQIEAALLKETEFDPATATITFRLGLSDYPAFVLLPSLLAALEKQAPHVSLQLHSFTGRDDAADLLDAGTIDTAIGVPPTQDDGRFHLSPLLLDEFVTILARKHPQAKRAMSMKAYLELQHILVSPEGDRYGLVDQALAQQGKQRKLGLTLAQMFVVPAIVAKTGMTATLMKRVVLHSPAVRQLAMFAPPVALPEIGFHLIWHRRSDGHPAQRWFRDFIGEQAALL